MIENEKHTMPNTLWRKHCEEHASQTTCKNDCFHVSSETVCWTFIFSVWRLSHMKLSRERGGNLRVAWIQFVKEKCSKCLNIYYFYIVVSWRLGDGDPEFSGTSPWKRWWICLFSQEKKQHQITQTSSVKNVLTTRFNWHICTSH